MAQNMYRNNKTWQDSVAMGPRLVRLSEELPMHEQTGLVMQIHQLMVELPAAIMQDILENSRMRFVAYYKLATTLELIDRIYPALDTATIRKSLDELGDRISGEDFQEIKDAPTTDVPSQILPVTTQPVISEVGEFNDDEDDDESENDILSEMDSTAQRAASLSQQPLAPTTFGSAPLQSVASMLEDNEPINQSVSSEPLLNSSQLTDMYESTTILDEQPVSVEIPAGPYIKLSPETAAMDAVIAPQSLPVTPQSVVTPSVPPIGAPPIATPNYNQAQPYTNVQPNSIQ